MTITSQSQDQNEQDFKTLAILPMTLMLKVKVRGAIIDIGTILYPIFRFHRQDLVPNKQRRNQDVPLSLF